MGERVYEKLRKIADIMVPIGLIKTCWTFTYLTNSMNFNAEFQTSNFDDVLSSTASFVFYKPVKAMHKMAEVILLIGY